MEYINGWTEESTITHLKKEFKGKSIDKSTRCSYRGLEGRKCVAGCFIPDNKYDSSMENYAVHHTNLGRVTEYFPFPVDVMLEWQKIHDNLDDLASVEEQLQALIYFLKR